jgi:hypothetical protein
MTHQRSKRSCTTLADQAVKSLCEIWHPQDIPGVFMTSSRATVTIGLTSNISTSHKPPPLPRRNTQLPSPVSPSTQPSPDSPPTFPSPAGIGSHISQQSDISTPTSTDQRACPRGSQTIEDLKNHSTNDLMLFGGNSIDGSGVGPADRGRHHR